MNMEMAPWGLGATITGHATNLTGRKISAMVTFNIYGKSGALIGNTSAIINDWPSGEIWSFSAPVVGEVSQARLANIKEL
jgi:hypothetical protein